MSDYITRSSADYKEVSERAKQAIAIMDELIDEHRPSIGHEVYLTSEEVMAMLDISPRTLQNYRDERIIPYTTIGGKFLYPQSALLDVLERNFIKALK